MEFCESQTSVENNNPNVNLNAGRDGAIIKIYNGLLRESYMKRVAGLEPLYDNNWKLNPSNRLGLLEREALKLWTRKWSVAGAGKMLDLMEPMEKKQLINPKTGNVTRFYMNRNLSIKGVNVFKGLNRLSTGLGVVGAGLTALRIANAKNKIRETKVVTGGFVGCYTAMVIGAPIAAKIGIAASPFLTPAGGVIVGAFVETGFGIAGAIGGEWLTEKALGDDEGEDE